MIMRGVEAGAARGRDGARGAVGRDVEGRGIDIGEHRRRAEERHHLGGRAEREGRADDGVAGADALRHQHQQQRVGAARAGHHVAGAAELGERRFERPHLGTENELAVLEHARDRGVDPAAEPAALGGNVDERDGRACRPGRAGS